MPISPAQCRAARALLSWSQDDLEKRSGISKRTIADFEREVRRPYDRTVEALRKTLDAHGVQFVPQNGGGDGVRLRTPVPRLLRREDVDHPGWVAFTFHYRNKTLDAFISHQTLAKMTPSTSPLAVFDRHSQRIIECAAEKFDRGERDGEGRILLLPGDVLPVQTDK